MKKSLIILAAILALAGCANTETTPKIVAHRGFWNCEEAGFAENSIASLAHAQQCGLWGSEFDVHMTSDSVVVVYHNAKIDGKRISENPLSEFAEVRLANGEAIPTLDEYLSQGEKSDRTMLVLELKKQHSQEHEAALYERSVELLKAHNLFDPSRVMFITFSHYLSSRIAAEHPEFCNQYLEGDIAPAELKAEGINGIDYEIGILREHPEWVQECKELGMSTNVWTVNDEEDMAYFVELGVDAITTNFPLVLKDIINTKN